MSKPLIFRNLSRCYILFRFSIPSHLFHYFCFELIKLKLNLMDHFITTSCIQCRLGDNNAILILTSVPGLRMLRYIFLCLITFILTIVISAIEFHLENAESPRKKMLTHKFMYPWYAVFSKLSIVIRNHANKNAARFSILFISIWLTNLMMCMISLITGLTLKLTISSPKQDYLSKARESYAFR